MILSLFLTAVVIALDLVSKHFFYGNAATSILGDFLWFESTLNKGAAFSIFSSEDMQVVFIVFSALAALVMLMLIVTKTFLKSKTEKILVAFILGGTIGNMIDRIIYGGVRDFIYLKFMNFAIFNVADMFITISIIILLIYVIVHMFKKEKND